MKLIFLDFDGVLNSTPWYTRRKQSQATGEMRSIDPAAVGLLNQLVDRTGAKVVVSSTWRMGGLHFVRTVLAERGFCGKVISITPQLCDGDGRIELVRAAKLSPKELIVSVSPPRGLEIQHWLDERDVKPEGIVIIDDDADMAHLSPFLVKTNFEDGLTQENVEDAIMKLRTFFPDWDEPECETNWEVDS
jgi:hypothetical protein